MKAFAEWRYSSTILELSHSTELSGKYHTSSALPMGKSPRYLLYRKLVWALWNREKCLPLPGIELGLRAHNQSLYRMSYI
jgi:hypothetical protein